MAWDGITFNRTADIAFLEGKQTYKEYIEVLDSHRVANF